MLIHELYQALLVLIICLVLKFGYKCYKLNRRLPPGPYGLPLLGVLPFLGKHPEKLFKKWSKQYGPIISVRMGTQLWVVLNNYESVHQALVKQSDEFCGRPVVPLYNRITKGHGLILVDSGHLWKNQRKFGVATLRALRNKNNSIEKCISEELYYLNEAIRLHDGKPFNISFDISNAVANNLCSVIMGKRFDYNDKRFRHIIEKVLEAFSKPEFNRTFNLLIFAPFLVYIPPFSKDAEGLIANLSSVFDMLKEIIEEHEATFDQFHLRDFIDAFLKEKKNQSDSSFTDLQLLNYTRDLFVAGIETTVSTLRWAILCLIHYPDTQAHLRKEILDVIGSEKCVKMSDRNNMPFTCAFIQEVYRYRTMVPLDVAHKTTRDVSFKGYFIPKGTTVTPNLYAVHNDSKKWNDSDVFNPERHLDSQGKFVNSPHVIPFSIGSRQCLGEPMGRMEIFMFIVSMMQKFEFKHDPTQSKLPNISDGSTGLGFVPYPFDMIAVEI